MYTLTMITTNNTYMCIITTIIIIISIIIKVASSIHWCAEHFTGVPRPRQAMVLGSWLSLGHYCRR